jgi:hypothetical protein
LRFVSGIASHDSALTTADLRAARPVMARNAHVPPPRRGDGSHFEDVALLSGLPCAGQAMRAVDVPVTWRDDILARFALVVWYDHIVGP